MKRVKLVTLLLAAGLLFTGCRINTGVLPVQIPEDMIQTVSGDTTETIETENTETGEGEETFDYALVPAYSGTPYAVMNENNPYFTELSNTSYQEYSDLDTLGRCGIAKASIGQDIMPTEKRSDIGMVKPSGWHNKKYDTIKDSDNTAGYLYNRCHLIGYQLTGQNANPKNLITGTRYLNVTGMLPFENQIADYVHETGNHVEYHVTPVFAGDDLLARGVLMEAESVEDKGKGIKFNVFCYNVQPGIELDYTTGENRLADESETAETEKTEKTENIEQSGYPKLEKITGSLSDYKYIVNINSKKIHTPDCKSAESMSPKNRRGYNGDLSDLTSAGYELAKDCDPEK